jgi:hypothetical protein
MLNKTDRRISWIAYVALALPVLIYLYAFQKYATNMPDQDDYDAILFWTLEFTNAHDFQEKFFLFFRQHNEHRIIADCFVNLLSMGLFHRINFIFISFCGSLGLFGITAIFLYIGKRNRLSIYELIPIPFLLLCLSQNQLISLAMAAVQQYWQLLFDISSILLLTISRNKAGFAMACVLAVLATFSGGGGLIVFPVGVVYLILGRKFPLAIIWIIVTGVTLYLFFIYFKYQPSPVGPQAHAYFWTHPFTSAVFIIGFLGNAARSTAMAMAFGVVFVVATVAMLAVNFKNRDATLIYIALLLFVSAVVVAQNRAFVGALFKFQVYLLSRYTIYGLSALAILYMLVMTSINDKNIRRFANFLGIFIAVTINLSWIGPGLGTLRLFHNFEKVALLPQPLVPQTENVARATLLAAMRQNIFFPVVLYRHLPPEIMNNKQYYHAWRELFGFYLTRPDLMQAFPLGAAVSYKPLLQWAANAAPENDPGYPQIMPYQSTYRSMLGVFHH